MGTLAELGINTEHGTVVLVEPPEDVLAEASRMKPRPTVVASLMHAAPGRWFVWWPGRGELDAGRLERMLWFLDSVADGEGWLVIDPDDDQDGMTPHDVEAALKGTPIRTEPGRTLASGEIALRVTASRKPLAAHPPAGD